MAGCLCFVKTTMKAVSNGATRDHNVLVGERCKQCIAMKIWVSIKMLVRLMSVPRAVGAGRNSVRGGKLGCYC